MTKVEYFYETDATWWGWHKERWVTARLGDKRLAIFSFN